MALEATHIRFALECAKHLEVKDLDGYFQGSIYPDSRYFTNIEREITHPENFLDWNLDKLTDFKKGWFTHLLCDKIQLDLIQREFPETIPNLKFGSESWIKLTAIKLLEDQLDAKLINTFSLITISPEELPHLEDRVQMSFYYETIKNAYQKPNDIQISDYQITLIKLGIPADVANKIITEAERYHTETPASAKFSQLFPELIQISAKNLGW